MTYKVDFEKMKTPYSAISPSRRRLTLFIVTIAGFIGPMSGNIYIPILPQLKDIFNTSMTTINGTVSVFMIIFGFAPLIWAPYADFGGRKTLYLLSLLIYIAANIVLATVPPRIAVLYIFRIFQAIGASSVISVGVGIVADIYEPKVRGKAISYFMIGPQLGPVLGPILSLIALNNNWRWIFGFCAIFATIVYILILICVPETLRCLVGNGSYLAGRNQVFVEPKLFQKRILNEIDSVKYPVPPKPTLKSWFNILKFKPALLCSVSGGLVFAGFYAMSVTFTDILQSNYEFKEYQSSLAYLCPGFSLIVGSLICGRLSDYVIQNKTPEEDLEKGYSPETRFSIQSIGCIMSSIGILGYGWCVDRHVHVAVVMIFIFVGGVGMTWIFNLNTTYLTECTIGLPVAMVSVGNMMRNVSAAISSFIIHKLIQSMGFGWCFTGLAILNLSSIVFTLWIVKCGSRWRAEFKSKAGEKKSIAKIQSVEIIEK